MKYFDVHHHAVPDFYAEALRNAGFAKIDGFPIPDWSVEKSLAFMDRASIRFAVLSLSVPGLDFLEGAEARDMAIRCNDCLAAAIKKHPDRLGFFATVPLDNPAEAIEETRRALDKLGAMGVGLFTNHRGTYPGDERFWPLYAELNARAATIFFHPTRSADGPEVGLRPPILNFPLDTTYAAAHLVTSGTLLEFPSIRWILSHAGGALPFLRSRIIIGGADIGRDQLKLKQYAEAMPKLSFDAIALDKECLQMAAKSSAHPLLFGSDYPYMPEEAIARVESIVRDSGLEMGTLELVVAN